MNMQCKVSVVIPCYNAEKHIKETILKIDSFFTEQELDFEIVPVNDGSKDNTEAIIDGFSAASSGRVNKVSYMPNMGKGEAVRRGILESKGKYIILIDADLPVDVTCMIQMLGVLETKEADFVIADRRGTGGTENAGLIRHLVSLFGFLTTRLILGIPFRDTQAGFKGLNAECAKTMARVQTIKRFAFDMEYLYVAKLYGLRVASIPVNYKNDVFSTTVHIVRDSLRTLLDVFRIRCNKKRYMKDKAD